MYEYMRAFHARAYRLVGRIRKKSTKMCQKNVWLEMNAEYV